MRSKALPPERQEAARAFARRIVQADFEGNVTQAARQLGISQAMLHGFLNGSRGAGPKLLEALASHTGVSIDEVLGRAPLDERRLVALKSHPHWSRMVATAAEQHPEIAPAYWTAVGEWSMPDETVRHADVPFIAGLARELEARERRRAMRQRKSH